MRIIALILLCLLIGTNLTVARRLPPKATYGPMIDLREFRSPAYTLYCLATLTAFLGIYTVRRHVRASEHH